MSVSDAAAVFGVAPDIVTVLAAATSRTSARVLKSTATNYKAISSAEGRQVAIYVHANLINIALDPADAEKVAASTRAGLIRKTPATHYVTVRSNFTDHRVEDAIVQALVRSQDRQFEHGERALHDLGRQAACPVHFIELPVSGICDDCG